MSQVSDGDVLQGLQEKGHDVLRNCAALALFVKLMARSSCTHIRLCDAGACALSDMLMPRVHLSSLHREQHMNSPDWSTLLQFFFDPSVGCCCCIPVVGFLSFVAGITHLSRQNAMRFEARLAQTGAHAALPKVN
jgi:hypothetical protein